MLLVNLIKRNDIEKHNFYKRLNDYSREQDGQEITRIGEEICSEIKNESFTLVNIMQ